jgi:acyl-CoA synthetase (AMP-forming)/AMP-acid ligase II
MYTLPAVLDRAQTLFPEGVVSDGNSERTYGEAYSNAERLAGALEAQGVEPGDVVAVADWNTPAFFELVYAITGMGAVVYPVNLNLPPEQIGYTLEKSESSWLLYSADFGELAENFPGPTVEIDDLSGGESLSLEVDQESDAVLLFTSGTTGMPKPVRYTHRKFVQGGLSIAHQLAEYDTPAALSAEDALYPGIPMFHLLSWGSTLIAPYLGADIVLAGQFDPDAAAAAVEDGDATWMNLVPTMVRQVLGTDRNLEGLKVLAGGSAIQSGLATQMRDRGVEFSTIYGGTDMLAAAISIWTDYARENGGYDHLRTVTHPVPFGEFRLAHREGMDEDMGEIEFRAPWLPEGYVGLPEESERAFVDGWFKTGDLGRRAPDGGIRILDRLDDTIKSGGEWIPTSVLESVIVEAPGVANAAVIGRPDEEWGERPVAAVTAAGEDLTVDAVETHLEEAASEGKINDWWIPEEISVVEEMPLTSTGKIQKDELRERFGIDDA